MLSRVSAGWPVRLDVSSLFTLPPVAAADYRNGVIDCLHTNVYVGYCTLKRCILPYCQSAVQHEYEITPMLAAVWNCPLLNAQYTNMSAC